MRVYPVSRVIFDLPSSSRYFLGRSKKTLLAGSYVLEFCPCTETLVTLKKPMNTVTHQPLMLQKCNFSTFYPILCWLILISEQKFLFSEHKYTKQYIAKTKYNLHNRVHRLNWIRIEFKFLTPSCHALDMINSKECNELFFNKWRSCSYRRNFFRIKKEAWTLVKALDPLNSSNVEYSDPVQMLQQQIGFLHVLLGLAYNFLPFRDWNQIFLGLIVVTKKQVFPRGLFAKSCMERERKLPTCAASAERSRIACVG